jgi:hypothetical protein
MSRVPANDDALPEQVGKQISRGLNFTPTSAKSALDGNPVRPLVMTNYKVTLRRS